MSLANPGRIAAGDRLVRQSRGWHAVNVLPGLLGLSFAFWGWQVDLIAVGLALGVGIEARHFIALGLDLSLHVC